MAWIQQDRARLVLTLTHLCLVLCCGCVPVDQTTPSPIPTPRTCGPFTVPAEAYLACALQGTDLILQTQAGQTVALTGHAIWTITGTVLYAARTTSLTETLLTLEGTAIVSVNGSTRIVPSGAQVILSLDDAGTIRNVSPQPMPYDTALVNTTLLTQLPRPLGLPTPIALPEDFAVSQDIIRTPGIGIATVVVACAVREEWDETRVKAGETLYAIATRYGLTAGDLQDANCLNNPNRLQIGQILRVPPYPTITPYAQPTFTPSIVAFRADSTDLAPGECTTLRWDVQNVSAIFIDEQPTVSSGVLPTCPTKTITYTLRVVYPDGTQTQHPLIITVIEATPP